MLSFSIPDLLNRVPAGEFDWNGPRGMKEFVLDGGAPAGVVETSLKKLRELPGVDGDSGS